MSGHSKWHSIKHKKAAGDKKKGKIFTKHAKLIAVAARRGGDPNMNPTLRAAIDNARAENMPSDNVERAIKKGTGEGKDAAQFEEVMYEGYGPGGVAIYIEALTDNRHRTIANLKTIVSKKGGNLGAAGSVGYMFQRRGLVEIPLEEAQSNQKSEEEIELAAIDAGADDVIKQEGLIEVFTGPQDLMQVKKKLEDAGLKVGAARLTYVPQTEVAVNDADTAKKLLDLIEAIEDDEDVSVVYSNDAIPGDIMEKISA
jgi:YebC/PmpR family DNA-binding regulatory protein